MKRAGLSGFRGPYDLRHSFATQLLERGVPITYVSGQLGHAKPTTTLAWYAHWLPSVDSHRFVDGLDQPGNLWHQFGCGSREFDHPEISHVISMAIDGCRDGIESAWRPR
ncbi:MAG TPA: tyrosine-type recombinase/integrase [Candidatus Binatia bacterium]